MPRPTLLRLSLSVILLLSAFGCGKISGKSTDRPPYGIYMVSIDGRSLTRLTATSFQENHVQLSPDASLILCTRYTADMNGDGVTNELDVESSATVIRSLTGPEEWMISDESLQRVIDYGAVWSDDGSRIAVSSNREEGRDGTMDIYVMNADGSDVRNLTRTPHLNEWDPHWAGETIAFNRYDPADPSSQAAIWLMTEDGTDQRQITYPQIPDDGSGAILGDTDPKISPDGTRLVFTRKLDGTSNGGNGDFDIFVADIDGGNIIDLTPTPEAEIGAQWSPDGNTIVFWEIHDDVEGNQSLALIDPDGANLRTIHHYLEAELWEEMPAFAPYREGGSYPVIFDAVEGAALTGSLNLLSSAAAGGLL